jgi:uncharacterized membrane protein YqjE
LIDFSLIGLLVFSSVTLLFALFPALWHRLIAAIDVRNWSRLTWLLANVVVVVILLSIRLAPDIKEASDARQAARARGRKVAERKKRADDRKERLARRIRRY